MDTPEMLSDTPEVRECFECGATAVRAAVREHRFKYGFENPVELSATIPVWVCDECGFAYTEGEGVELRQEAMRRCLGTLTPAKR